MISLYIEGLLFPLYTYAELSTMMTRQDLSDINKIAILSSFPRCQI